MAPSFFPGEYERGGGGGETLWVPPSLAVRQLRGQPIGAKPGEQPPGGSWLISPPERGKNGALRTALRPTTTLVHPDNVLHSGPFGPRPGGEASPGGCIMTRETGAKWYG